MRGSFKRESFVTSVFLEFHKSRKKRCCILTLSLVVAAVSTNMCSPGGLEAEGDLGQENGLRGLAKCPGMWFMQCKGVRRQRRGGDRGTDPSALF